MLIWQFFVGLVLSISSNPFKVNPFETDSEKRKREEKIMCFSVAVVKSKSFRCSTPLWPISQKYHKTKAPYILGDSFVTNHSGANGHSRLCCFPTLASS